MLELQWYILNGSLVGLTHSDQARIRKVPHLVVEWAAVALACVVYWQVEGRR